MQIQSDIVYDARSGELIGFVGNKEELSPDEDEALATHVLVFYVVGVNVDLSMSVGFFPTKGMSASDLYPKLWQAIGLLELVCGLKVRFP